MALLERCAGVTVLATSREPLRLPGEVVWRVPSLELPDLRLTADPARLARLDSVQLFCRARAKRIRRRSSSTPRLPSRSHASVSALTAYRWRLSWPLPGSRIWRPRSSARLDDALATLAGRIHGVPDRQATLAATLDWSHELLADDQRAVFHRLSVFACGFTLDAAEEVCAGGLSNRSPRWSHTWWTSLRCRGGERRPGPFPAAEVIRQYAAGVFFVAGLPAGGHACNYASRAESLDPDLGSGVVGEPSP